jgi:hypothetical protein
MPPTELQIHLKRLPSTFLALIALYFEACQIYEDADRLRLGLDMFKRGIIFFIKNQRFTSNTMVLIVDWTLR